MKTILPALLACLTLSVSFAKDNGLDPNDPESLERIIAEAIVEKEKPSGYTGWVKEMRGNGRIAQLAQYKDGKPDELQTEWYENGQRASERNYKGGKLMSADAWQSNGEKCPDTNLKDGNGFLVEYHQIGWKSEANYKGGKEHGLAMTWYENGQKRSEANYKDGSKDGIKTTWKKKDGLPEKSDRSNDLWDLNGD